MRVESGDQMWGAKVTCSMSWSFAWFKGEDFLHCVGYVVKSEIHWSE